MKSLHKTVASLVLALLLVACGSDECLRHSDCPSQLVCSAYGVCEWPPAPDASESGDDPTPIRNLPDGGVGTPDAEDGI